MYDVYQDTRNGCNHYQALEVRAEGGALIMEGVTGYTVATMVLISPIGGEIRVEKRQSRLGKLRAV